MQNQTNHMVRVCDTLTRQECDLQHLAFSLPILIVNVQMASWKPASAANDDQQNRDRISEGDEGEGKLTHIANQDYK